jgi:hypothetical protein
VRIRRGFVAMGNMGDAVDIKGDLENVILDHVSTSWATDENLTLTKANHVTAQYCIAAEGLDYFNPNQSPNRHSEGSLFGSGTAGGVMSIHHSIYAHNRLRNPRTTGGGSAPPELDFRNNVIYDWKEFASHTGSEAVHLNLVNNYYKEGPSTGVENDESKGVIFTFMSEGPHRLYAAGNIMEGYESRTRDNWEAIRFSRPGKPGAKKKVDVAAARASAPLPTPPVTTQTAAEALDAVLADAGATLPARDAIDLRIVNDVRNRTGAVINFESDIPAVGRWQQYRSLAAPADSDGDGIPDYWQHQFSLPEGSAQLDTDGDGYTNIEEYLNNTDPRGGSLPLVYISASVSRAWRGDARPGEFLLHRTGPVEKPLAVHFLLGTEARTVAIAAGLAVARFSVPPGVGDLVVASIEADSAYHIGCPRSALVVVEDGAAPKPVDIAAVDPRGGVSDAVRHEGEANMEEHKKWKVDKKK